MRNNGSFIDIDVPLIVLQDYLPSAAADVRQNIVLSQEPVFVEENGTFRTLYQSYSEQITVYLNGETKKRYLDYELEYTGGFIYVKFLYEVSPDENILFDYIRK